MREAKDEVSPEAPARQIRLLEPHAIEEREHRVLEERERVRAIRFVGIAVPGEIHRDDSPPPAEEIDELLVLFEARRDPVEHHERRPLLLLRRHVDVPET